MEDRSKINPDRSYYMFALRIMGDFGVSIAVPVVVFVLLGEYLEERYNFNPWGKVAGFCLAAVTSAISISKKTKKYGAEYQSLSK